MKHNLSVEFEIGNSCGQNGAQLGGQFVQGLGENARLGDNGHEVCVSLPARDDMDVQMVGYPGAGGFAQIEADVESVGLGQLRQRVDTTARELPQVRQL